MVDIIKPFSTVLPLFDSNIHGIQIRSSSASTSAYEQISLPNFLNSTSPINRLNIINNAKRWIGRCPGDPPRSANISNSPYSLHKKIICRELSRCCPITVTDLSLLNKFKHIKTNNNREPLKVTTVPSNTDISNSNDLFNDISKQVTVKGEPIRTTNHFLNQTSSSSSWQKYWASIHIQRRGKQINESESNFHCSKRDQTNVHQTTHFVTVRDTSFHINTESQILISSTSPIISDQKSSSIEDNQSTSFPQLVSSEEKISSMNLIKVNNDKSFLTIQNESLIVNENNNNNELNTITRQLYELPLPSNKSKRNKSPTKIGIRSKSLEKKSMGSSNIAQERKQSATTLLPNTSTSKRRCPTATSHKAYRCTLIKKQQQTLATIMNTTPRSKYEQRKWDEPYIGVRFDPPTPPSSPSLFVWPQDSDRDDNDTSIEQNSKHDSDF